MIRTLRIAPLLLLSSLSLTACAANQAQEVQTKIVYQPLPDTTCRDNPTPPADNAGDKETAAYIRDRFDAGDDCRDKLHAVDDARKSWPATPDAAQAPTKPKTLFDLFR